MANANVHLFGLQVDILDSKSEQLSPANSGSGGVWLHFATFTPGPRPWSHRRTAVTWTFSVEAKGLEPSNLLTAR
jgi:hypothetical protein